MNDSSVELVPCPQCGVAWVGPGSGPCRNCRDGSREEDDE